uniref:Uncharacterized protein n=1 Tax=Nymphaea colorata TaxID=210225 RepID=A0A5K0XT84_9MAGN
MRYGGGRPGAPAVGGTKNERVVGKVAAGGEVGDGVARGAAAGVVVAAGSGRGVAGAGAAQRAGRSAGGRATGNWAERGGLIVFGAVDPEEAGAEVDDELVRAERGLVLQRNDILLGGGVLGHRKDESRQRRGRRCGAAWKAAMEEEEEEEAEVEGETPGKSHGSRVRKCFGFKRFDYRRSGSEWRKSESNAATGHEEGPSRVHHPSICSDADIVKKDENPQLTIQFSYIYIYIYFSLDVDN